VKEYDLLLLKKITKAINLSIEENRIVYLDSLRNELRKYIKGSPQYEFYVEQHKNQTYETVCKSIKKYSMLGRKKMKMKEALLLMDNFVDPSDPDVDLPNSVHAYQTAERIRKKHPLDYELQITGLIHDLGKILFEFGEPNWNVVGDTFVLGCKFPETIILYDTLKENPDYNNPKYCSENGIYELKCGIKNLKLAFGHDEYLYIVLKNNYNHFLSDKYLNIIRFHSFYPWHTGNSYLHLEDETDLAMKKDILDFNQYDLYSKEDTDFVLTDEIKKYYDNLLDKYFPDELLW
jgi:inositol oxygenase